ncbi:cadherin domain-containing protein, partial [Prosthecomicrobium sp. N25]|uniref:cadherin domain-containing protein n=1 Tax=Prosthecomicrobium sp. N25 TaxID=3129254 RepID=UPI0030787816
DNGPSDILVSGGTIAENSAGGTVVATLSTVDADTGESFTYSLAGTDAGLFTVVGNEIRVAPGAVLDFEAGGTRTFDLTVTDAAGHTRTETVTVNLTDVNDNGPSDIIVTGGTIAENSAAGTVVATLSTVDADTGESFSYSLVGTDAASFVVVGNEIRVAPGAVLDFEAGGTRTFDLTVTDAAGHSRTETVTVDLTDVNDNGPSDILVSGGTIAENSAGGTVVATLSTVDADTGESFTYSLAGTDAGLFTVVGNEIRVAPGAVLDFEAGGTRTFDLTVTDAAGHTRTETVTVNLTDVNDNGP